VSAATRHQDLAASMAPSMKRGARPSAKMMENVRIAQPMQEMADPYPNHTHPASGQSIVQLQQGNITTVSSNTQLCRKTGPGERDCQAGGGAAACPRCGLRATRVFAVFTRWR
jgi:hypothetical protein